MTLVITGATGFLGQHIVAAALAKEKQVLALGRNLSKFEQFESPFLETAYFDLTSPTSQWAKLPTDSIIIHAAAAISGATQDVLDAVNVEGTQKLIDFAQKHNVKQFIHISTISTYNLSHEGNLSESAKQHPQSTYGQSKLVAEKLVMDQLSNYTIFRPPFIGGPNDPNFLAEMFKRLKAGKLPKISRDGEFGYIDVRDFAKQILNAVEYPKAFGQVFNIQGDRTNYHEFIHKLAEICNYSPPKRTLPFSVIMVIAFLNELLGKLRGKNMDASLSRYRIRTLTSKRTLNTEKLDKVLPFTYRSIESSLKDWAANLQVP